MAYEFDWVDAFTDKTFGGNACVEVHNADGLTFDQRLALVRETSLSECAYIVDSDVADFGARYYLADREILMAGHPTIATVTSLLNRNLVGDGNFTLEVGAGVLPINVKDGVVTMTQAKPSFHDTNSAASIAEIYGLAAEDIRGTPQIVSTGTPFCIAVLKDHDALRRATLNVEKLMEWRANSREALAGLMEPYLVVCQGVSGGDTFVRLLLPPPMPAEDPFTGSATGCAAAYLWKHGFLNQPNYVAEQGQWLDRPGTAQVEVLGPREEITGVRVGGQGRVLMSGTLDL